MTLSPGRAATTTFLMISSLVCWLFFYNMLWQGIARVNGKHVLPGY